MVVRYSEDILDAARRNDEEAVKYFVEVKHIPVTTIDEGQQTAAHIAAERGHLSILKYLLSRDDSLLRLEDSFGNNVLHLAIEAGLLDIVKYLVNECGADIFHPIDLRLGNTAVHLAAQSGHLPILQYLIEERYANYDLKNKIGEPPLFLAANKQHLHIVKYLVERWNANVFMKDVHMNNILFVSAKVGDLHVPKYLLDEQKKPLNPNYKDFHGRTIMHWAAALGWLDFMKYFVEEKNVKFDTPDSTGKTPLHLAAAADNVQIVMYLIRHKANPFVKDMGGRTPLDDATDTKVITYLQDVTHHYRRRRNVVTLPNQPTFNLSRGIPFIRRDSFWSEGQRIKGSESTQTIEVNSFHARNFLSLAVAFVKYSRASVFQGVKRAYLLSPQEIVESKMDPVAVMVVNRPTSKFQNEIYKTF